MRIINKTAENISNGILTIGYVGENEHTQVVIDCASVFEQYPSAVPAMTIQPPSGDAYPALITRNGNNIIWDVRDTDTANNGSGEIQLTFIENNVVVKSCIGMIKVNRSIVPSGDMPTPIEDWLVEANTALNAIPQTIDDALEEAKESGEFDGEDGYTPVKGVDYFDGEPGAKGDKGDAGYTPVKGVDYFDGAPGAKGDKGDPGDPTELIDDTTTASNKAWSSQKTSNEVNAKYAKPSGGIPASDLSSAVQTSLSSADSAYQKPSGGIPASDLASGVIPSVPVHDVQANGVSIVSNGVANFPMPDEDNFGVVKVMRDTGYYGIGRTSTGYLTTSPATDYQIKDGTDSWKPINPVNQHRAVFYGLAKAALDTTQSQSSNPVGTYTDAAKVAIQKMLGIYEAPWELIREDSFTNASEASYTISVDGNGQSFQLTDIVLVLIVPTQNNSAVVGDNGIVSFFQGSLEIRRAYTYESSSLSISANSSPYVANIVLEHNKGLLKTSWTEWAQNESHKSWISVNGNAADGMQTAIALNDSYFDSINIKSFTGTMNYRLFGKRKWT